MSDQNNGGQSEGTLKWVRLSPTPAVTAAAVGGTIGFVMLVLAGIASWPEGRVSTLRTLGIVMFLAALVVVQFARDRAINQKVRARDEQAMREARARDAQAMRAVQDRQEFILDRIDVIAAEHRAFTEDLLQRQQRDLERAMSAWSGLQTSVDDARSSIGDAQWRVNELAAVVQGSEVAAAARWDQATVRWEDFNGRADQLDERMKNLDERIGFLDERMEALVDVLVKVKGLVEERIPPPQSGQVTPINRRQGGPGNQSG